MIFKALSSFFFQILRLLVRFVKDVKRERLTLKGRGTKDSLQPIRRRDPGNLLRDSGVRKSSGSRREQTLLLLQQFASYEFEKLRVCGKTGWSEKAEPSGTGGTQRDYSKFLIRVSPRGQRVARGMERSLIFRAPLALPLILKMSGAHLCALKMLIFFTRTFYNVGRLR